MTKLSLRVAIYARFSTDKQRDASNEDQIDSCRELTAREGWQITGTYLDRATSGANMFRPGIEALQRDASLGKFDLVLSEAMERLSRKLADIAKFHERMEHLGIKINTLTEGEVTEMLIGMKGTMNQILLRDIAIKTHRGQKGRVKEASSPEAMPTAMTCCPGWRCGARPNTVIGPSTGPRRRSCAGSSATVRKACRRARSPRR